MKPRVVRLHIRQLVLEGFEPADRRHIGIAVETELARILREESLPRSVSASGTIRRIDAGTFKVVNRSAVGTQIARAVYGGLKR